MAHLIDQIKSVKNQLVQALDRVANTHELEDVRIAFMGRNGHLTHLMNQLKALSLEEKKERTIKKQKK